MNDVLKAIRDPKLLVVLLMGFSSGLPLLLIGATLKAWLTEQGIDLKTIGFFSLVGLPYTWKFVWSPLMDRYTPWLGRRRGWLLISQLGLVISLVLLSTLDAHSQISLVAGCAFVVAFFSASQDIVVDAYRREILPDHELGLGSSLYVLGYRVAMLVAGAGSLLMADQIPWPQVYWAMAALMLLGMAVAFLCPEPKVDLPPPKSLRESILGPLAEFFKRDGVWTILAFILLYKIGESMATDMFNTFFLKSGFTKTQIATVAKVFGFWATILGGLVGGTLIVRLGNYGALWIFGVLQSLALLLFSVLANVGTSLPMLAAAIGCENFTSGMATTAYVAFMASQTNKRFTATQYALLSSLMGIPRTLFGASTGVLAEMLGWSWYFIACAIFTIPGLLLLFRLRPFLHDTASEMKPRGAVS